MIIITTKTIWRIICKVGLYVINQQIVNKKNKITCTSSKPAHCCASVIRMLIQARGVVVPQVFKMNLLLDINMLDSLQYSEKLSINYVILINFFIH